MYKYLTKGTVYGLVLGLALLGAGTASAALVPPGPSTQGKWVPTARQPIGTLSNQNQLFSSRGYIVPPPPAPGAYVPPPSPGALLTPPWPPVVPPNNPPVVPPNNPPVVGGWFPSLNMYIFCPTDRGFGFCDRRYLES